MAVSGGSCSPRSRSPSDSPNSSEQPCRPSSQASLMALVGPPCSVRYFSRVSWVSCLIPSAVTPGQSVNKHTKTFIQTGRCCVCSRCSVPDVRSGHAVLGGDCVCSITLPSRHFKERCRRRPSRRRCEVTVGVRRRGLRARLPARTLPARWTHGQHDTLRHTDTVSQCDSQCQSVSVTH